MLNPRCFRRSPAKHAPAGSRLSLAVACDSRPQAIAGRTHDPS